MKRKFVQIAAVFLVMLVFSTPLVGAEPVTDAAATVNTAEDRLVRVGLYYGSNTLPGANLLNSVGNGYRFCFDNGNGIQQIGYTYESGISMVKTQNVYYFPRLSDNRSGYTDKDTSNVVVGCYHIALDGIYESFDQAKAVADTVGGFPAYIKGQFQVRIGAYTSASAAESAQQSLGLADTSVVGTSSYGITVVVTGTAKPIFQYDGGSENPMFIVTPGVDDSVKAITHFKGYKYYGSFRYERINGGNLTVVNLVGMEDYVRGILPYEMSASWPVEALKAQAVCARSYTLTSFNRHSGYHFDTCNTTDCQVYYGTAGANDVTERAVVETAGQYAWYNGSVIQAFYHSSDGGATENCENVWNQAIPYLRGVTDPYEALVADKIPGYYWSKTFTGKQLQTLFRNKGFQCGEIADIRVSKISGTGNVCSVTFTDVNGKSWTVSKDNNVRSLFGVKSLRYTISPGGDGYALADGQFVGSLPGTWVLGGDGTPVQILNGNCYAMTGSGLQAVKAPANPDGIFVFNGSGHGHNLGMSQWGAYAMANEGYTYEDILKFYFTGIEIHT